MKICGQEETSQFGSLGTCQVGKEFLVGKAPVIKKSLTFSAAAAHSLADSPLQPLTYSFLLKFVPQAIFYMNPGQDLKGKCGISPTEVPC